MLQGNQTKRDKQASMRLAIPRLITRSGRVDIHNFGAHGSGSHKATRAIALTPLKLTAGPLTRIIHECRRETFETEACRGFSQVRPT